MAGGAHREFLADLDFSRPPQPPDVMCHVRPWRTSRPSLRNSAAPQQPGLLGCLATIALAIGANTAMFSFVHGMLLSPLPYPESDSIVRVLEKLPNGAPNNISTLNYLDWANQNGVFECMAAEAGWRATLTGGNEPVSIRGALVSAY